MAVAGEYFFYFMLYSFLGWVLEGSYSLYSAGTFRKKGFLRGPFKPMYGFAPLLLLSAKDLGFPFPLIVALALIIPSAVEYASGWLLKAAFHKQWWDYSEMPYQMQGHICLKFSLYWWGLALACMYGLHPFIEMLYRQIEPLWLLLLPLAALMLTADLLWTCRTRRHGLKGLELREG
ncbi:putative ABC transporter permease [Paenibacillus sp. HW567]|uniref:putative ABC transporter permease n=1 Tax=Paenibacillus sp. HW567 TaxID=1034769 RepID=UPI00039ADF64|nr:putative ABC transporter permease [Paenibacillus sp. HW567]